MSRPLMAVNLAGSQEESFINWDKRFKKKKKWKGAKKEKESGGGEEGKREAGNYSSSGTIFAKHTLSLGFHP